MMMKNKILSLMVVGFLFLSVGVEAAAVVFRSASLMWDMNTNNPPTVVSRVYQNIVPARTNLVMYEVNTNSLTLSNLAERTTYSFYVKSYDTNSMLESAESSNTILIQAVPDTINSPALITLKSLTGTNNWSTYVLISPPTNGSITGTPPSSIIYRPSFNYTGKDSFTYRIDESLSQLVTGYVDILVKNQIIYIGTRLEWYTNLLSINRSNFNLRSFTNPPAGQFYRSYLILTNNPLVPKSTYLRTRLEWYTNLGSLNRGYYDLMSFTNPPVPQFYRSYLVITNNPF